MCFTSVVGVWMAQEGTLLIHSADPSSPICYWVLVTRHHSSHDPPVLCLCNLNHRDWNKSPTLSPSENAISLGFFYNVVQSGPVARIIFQGQLENQLVFGRQIAWNKWYLQIIDSTDCGLAQTVARITTAIQNLVDSIRAVPLIGCWLQTQSSPKYVAIFIL